MHLFVPFVLPNIEPELDRVLYPINLRTQSRTQIIMLGSSAVAESRHLGRALADDLGRLPFVSWPDVGVQERIHGARISTFTRW
jgi:hypothetical protein